MDGIMIFWLAAIVFFAVVEIVTFQLVAIWLSAGSVLGLLCATFDLPVWMQFSVFLVGSAVLLILTRPICRRLLTKKRERTNVDRHIGSVAVVSEEIDNLKQTGRAVISGVPWMARSVDGSVIQTGETVRVERIEGVKLIVSRSETME